MRENKAAQAKRVEIDVDTPDEELRVTDRRRINLDGDVIQGDSDGTTSDESRLKPTYVAQLEASKAAAEQKLVEVQARFDQLRTQLQRDMDETRQRLNRAADDRARNDRAEFVGALLPVMENLYRAIESAEGGTLESLLEGVRGTAKGFESALKAVGVEPVESVGVKFDPEMHDAVDTIEVEPGDDGKVKAEYSRGYRIGDRLLRPARVQVGRARDGERKAAE